MPRIRSIKPEFWGDFDTAEHLTRDARLLYIALWNFADEHARMPGDRRFVKGQCFPYDDDLTPDVVQGLLDELAAVGNVVLYTVDGSPYLFLPHLDRHQRLEPGKVPSRLPAPPDPDGSAPGLDESAPRADVSARDADESSLKQVAGGREQAAGGKDARTGSRDITGPSPVDNNQPLPPQLEILRAKLEARKLHVRWDKLTPETTAEMVALVELHGDATLVRSALNAYRPDSPAAFAQAWLKDWRSLPPPGRLKAVDEPACDKPGHNGTTRFCVECTADRLAGDA